MANKRRPVSFPELEGAPKGRGAILRTADEVAAEQEHILASQEASVHVSQQAGEPADWQTEVQESQQAGRRAEYPKVTYRLSPEALEAIDDAKRLLRRQYKWKVSFEEIAEEAILAICADLQENQEASILVNKLSGKQESKKPRS